MADDARVDELLKVLLDSGGTPEELCRSCPELLASVRARWQQLRALQAEVGALFPESPSLDRVNPNATRPHAPPTTDLPDIRGYAVQELLGHGGMGVVYKAWHLRLQRTVAVKMLLAGAYAQPQELERFLREAETVAGLSHPNIVQVHEAGDVVGRPYFTMEFVEGGSLAQKLAGTPQPARQAAALVAKVAEAVHAAHRRGIVHRDLKPGNILLTADGTPKLTDFGLARRLEGPAGLTQSGVPVGTPSYMAPEQAEGKARAVGPAADTYALGAILYELLTGGPPFRAETAAETLRQVVFQDPVPPSRLNAALPRDVETICLKCLHKEPERRYVSAAALADDLRRFLQGEAIRARPEGRLERFARWARRRPALVSGLTAAVLLTTALVGAGLWVRAERAATERAQEQLARLDQARRDQEFVARLDAIRLNRAAVIRGRFDIAANRARAGQKYEVAFRDAGFGEVGDDPAVVAATVEASNLRGALLAALDDRAICATDEADEPRRWLLEVARRADPDPTGSCNRLRDPEAWKNPAVLTELTGTAPVKGQPVQLLVALGERLRDTGGDATSFLLRVQREHPHDFWANLTLGDTLREKNPGEAVRYYQAALAVRPGAAVVHNNLGLVMAAQDRVEEAISHYQKAFEIDPDFGLPHYHLGLSLRPLGRVDEAIDHFLRAVQIDPEFGLAHYNLGLALRTKGEVDEAIDHHLQALRIEPGWAAVYGNLALALADKGQLDEAIDRYQQALRLEPGYTAAHNDLGLALADKGRWDEAIKHHQEALRLDATDGYAYWAMGRALLAQGRFREALAATRRSLDLLPQSHPQRAQCLEQSERCDSLLALEGRLPAVLQGKEKPTGAAECLRFADLCRVKKQFAAAARLYAEAFAAAPPLAEGLHTADRYHAACAAAVAGSGRGDDASKLSEAEPRRWRRQAREWLQADLTLWVKKLETGPVADRVLMRKTLRQWRADPDLAGLREPSALETLSADERQECLALWQSVASLLDRAEAMAANHKGAEQ
jgi:serine/threonine-protein kinase